MTTDENTPDIFADSIALAAGPFGFTMSLYLSDPSNLPAPGSETTEANLGRLVGRVRIAPELMAAFLSSATAAVEAHAKQVGAKTEASK